MKDDIIWKYTKIVLFTSLFQVDCLSCFRIWQLYFVEYWSKLGSVILSLGKLHEIRDFV